MSFRILSLDGGGAWALIQVRALIALYNDKAETTGHRVLSDFDLAAANSGGSLVLGGLVEDLPLSTLLTYFEDETKRKSIFAPLSSWGDKAKDWAIREAIGVGPKYSTAAKLSAIDTLLPKQGNKPLAAAAAGIRRTRDGKDIHLLITSFDYDRNRSKFFRSAPAGKGPAWGDGASTQATLAEAIHASTNAPVNYFDSPASFPILEGRYWDGGITGCNNPVLAAVTEARALGLAPDEIIALSIGTGTVALPLQQTGQQASCFTQPVASTGLAADIGKLARAILDDPPDVASYLAHVMTGAAVPSRIVRMSPLISPKGNPGNWTPPDGMTPSQFTYLSTLDMDAIDQQQVNAISSCAALWLQGKVRNQPIRMDGDTLTLELGSLLFKDAAKDWENLKQTGGQTPVA